MKTINIYESFNKYNNDECFAIIKFLIRKKDLDTFQKVLCISHTMSFITNDNLLNSTIELLKECDWFKSEAQIKPVLKYVSSNNIYDIDDVVKFRAIIYSIALNYEVHMAQWGEVFIRERPELSIFVKDKFISHNLKSIYDNIRKLITNFVVENYIEPLKPLEQQIEFKRMINSMAKVDYMNETNSFEHEIKYLSTRGNNTINFDTISQIKSEPFYVKVTSLFAQGLINTIKTGKGKIYTFGELEFNSTLELRNHLHKDLFNSKGNCRQYVTDTINGSGQKNLYDSVSMMKNTLEHCKQEGKDITPEFQSKYDSLIN